jgi:SAM-dependent methyltransferase
MDSQFACMYRQLHEQHWWWRARQSVVLEVVRRWNGDRPQRFLDIGCGDGLLFDELSRWGEVEGVEVDSAIVSDDNPWRDRIYIGPFDEQFQPDRRYTTILMLDVLEHLPHPQAALQQALGLLEPDGKLILTVPAFRLLWTTHDLLNHHYTRYTKASLSQVAMPWGRIEESRYFFHWLFAAKLGVRLKEMLLTTEPRSPRLPHPLVNAACYYLSRCEEILCRKLPIPVGCSLLAVLTPTPASQLAVCPPAEMVSC